ncbi:MAG: GC-type dockerin domain-anchored protein [Phycisphaerales bacterium JB039]
MSRNPISRTFARTAMLALAAMAASGSTASAADCCRWELEVKRQAVLSDKFDVKLYAHFPDSGHAFAGGALDLLTDGVKWTSINTCGPAVSPGSFAGSIVGDDVLGIVVGQLHFPPGGIFADTDNPILVWCGEFESQCGIPAIRKVWTETDKFAYYDDASSSTQTSCDPVEAYRKVFCGPIVVPGGWLLAPLGDTEAKHVGKEVVLTCRRAGGDIEASLGDERIDWSARGASFGASFDLGALEPGAALDLTWYPTPNCWIVPGPYLSLTATKRSADAMLVSPDLTGVAISTVPVRGYLDGKLVGEGVVTTGGSFSLFKYCTELTFRWVLNQFDEWVLVLECGSPFSMQFVGGAEIKVDRIELAPRGTAGDFGGVDEFQVRARGASALTILDAGAMTGGCYADCDGSGVIDFFDFLCFQNEFATGAPYADCDGNGILDFFDFLCFQNEFAAGCR